MSTATLSAPTTTATSTWVRAGLVGGVVAGIVFAMFEMITAALLNGSEAFFMPLRMIGAIGVGSSALDPASSLLSAGAAGLVIHMALSMMYGVAVAAALALDLLHRLDIGEIAEVAAPGPSHARTPMPPPL